MKKYCKACNKEIYFLQTKNGKNIPVNAETLSEEEVKQIANGEKVIFDSKRHISHFADCPEANKFRRNKK